MWLGAGKWCPFWGKWKDLKLENRRKIASCCQGWYLWFLCQWFFSPKWSCGGGAADSQHFVNVMLLQLKPRAQTNSCSASTSKTCFVLFVMSRSELIFLILLHKIFYMIIVFSTRTVMQHTAVPTTNAHMKTSEMRPAAGTQGVRTPRQLFRPDCMARPKELAEFGGLASLAVKIRSNACNMQHATGTVSFRFLECVKAEVVLSQRKLLHMSRNLERTQSLCLQCHTLLYGSMSVVKTHSSLLEHLHLHESLPPISVLIRRSLTLTGYCDAGTPRTRKFNDDLFLQNSGVQMHQKGNCEGTKMDSTWFFQPANIKSPPTKQSAQKCHQQKISGWLSWTIRWKSLSDLQPIINDITFCSRSLSPSPGSL